MQYMLMCCFDEKAWTKLPNEDRESIMREYGELMQSLAKRGHLRGSGKLRSSSSATTVRMKNGKPILTDGGIPTLPAGGAIEVRPLEPFAEKGASVSE